ncbi:MAG: lysostaphin resistance A-like protein [Candidatus Korobacteraceae bacterium]
MAEHETPLASRERGVNLFFGPDDRLRAGWRAVLGIVAAYATSEIAATLAFSVGRPGKPAFDLVYRPLAMALMIAVFSAMEVVLDRVQGSPLAAQGLPSRNWAREFLLGLAIGSMLIAIAVAALGLTGGVSLTATGSDHPVAALLGVLFVLSTAALLEELMFRGYPFQRLVEALGAAPAILVLSALFGYVHIRNPHASTIGILNTVLVGILLAVAYLRTRALWLPWGIHLAWNATLGVVFGLRVSGLDLSVLVKGTTQGPEWLTGGDYGLEASVLGSVVILLGFLPVLWLFPGQNGGSIQQDFTLGLEPGGISGGEGHPKL